MKVNQKGPLPAWRLVYDAVHERGYGASITEEELKILLADYASWRGPLYKATKKMEENDKKTVLSVRGNGYAIANPNEHVPLGSKRILRSRRQLYKAKHTIEGTDMSMLKAHEKVEKLDMESRISWIIRATNKRKLPAETTPAKSIEHDEIKEHLEAIDKNMGWIRSKLKKKGVST